METIKLNILVLAILTIVNNIGVGQGRLCPTNKDVFVQESEGAEHWTCEGKRPLCTVRHGGTRGTPSYGRMGQIDFTIEVSHEQRGVREDFEHVKKIRSSSDFVEKHKDISGGFSASGSASALGLVSVSASLSANFQVVLNEITDSKRFSHDEKTTKTVFQQNTLQVFRVVKTTLSIDGVTATTEERDWVDTVAVDQRLSTSKRHQMSKDYISRRYTEEDGEFTHDGAGFSFTACQLKVDVLDYVEFDRTEICKNEGASPFCKNKSHSSLKSCIKDSLEWAQFADRCILLHYIGR